jgi:hypothetical protein
VDHIRRIPGVRWVTATDLPRTYPDLIASEGASESDLDEIARRLTDRHAVGVDYQRIGSKVFSVADQFELLSRGVDDFLSGRKIRFPLTAKGLIGPDSAPRGVTAFPFLNTLAFRDSARSVTEYIQSERRIPSRVFVGPDSVRPADFLIGLAEAWKQLRANGNLPADARIPLGSAVRLIPERHIAEDTPDLFGGWAIHKEGFRAPRILEQARLQAWTLKPALLRP